MTAEYDAILLLSFGGPEKPDDVLPFLENVVRGKNVPQDRMLEAAAHYDLFDGVSPINMQNRALLTCLIDELNRQGPALPVYWGNRNWHPMLADTLEQMAGDGIQHALAVVTSAFGSYSGCRQYLEDIEQARSEVGDKAPQVDKLRLFYNHPGFIEPMADRVSAAIEQIPADRRDDAKILFAAHSLPVAMAEGCEYVSQVEEACRLTASQAGIDCWKLVYQSRSGPPTQPWLEPDIGDYLLEQHETVGIRDVVVVPIGFLSEHMEVVYDLDIELAALCDRLEINFVRAGVVGTDPRFVSMIRELVLERVEPGTERRALGSHGPAPDACPENCCPRPQRPARPRPSQA